MVIGKSTQAVIKETEPMNHSLAPDGSRPGPLVFPRRKNGSAGKSDPFPVLECNPFSKTGLDRELPLKSKAGLHPPPLKSDTSTPFTEIRSRLTPKSKSRIPQVPSH